MKLHLTAQQLKLFTEQGYIAFENLPLDLPALKKEIETAAKDTVRDLWRKAPLLQTTAVRKLGPIALQLTRKKSLHLACDEWISSKENWDTSSAVQHQLSFQGLSCIVCILFDGKSPCFFMHPSSWPGIIPYWPKEPVDCYLIAYTGSEGRYVLNAKDPHTHWLKKFGFAFGDTLQKNPLIL